MDFTALGNFIKDFGLGVSLALLFVGALVWKPKGSPNPYLITGSMIDAKDRELTELRAEHTRDRADWQRRYDEDRAEWSQREARERSQRMQSEQKLTETLATMDRVVDVMSELRLDLARLARIEPPK